MSIDVQLEGRKAGGGLVQCENFNWCTDTECIHYKKHKPYEKVAAEDKSCHQGPSRCLETTGQCRPVDK